ncbi:gamma-glutamylcysteine synthetase [Alloscardovia theropitheci]|uniref:Glutamate--cysteine ligase n=1 Tax=Alloscardovia theropitheci TaxID=2496842 RepID=A0A4R0QPP9_9BIFI|nr:glutamate-cysteine ligase family protein [Alloscardovia theropitheci]TCD54222.1 gamma-glutamylcysteine synthetase [Alloscardovia theropitheci]
MHNDFSYFHQDQHVNDKHVQSLVRFYESGCVPREKYGIGVEIEHIPVRYGTNASVTYDEPHGIRDVLNDLAPLYDSSMEYRDGTALLGLGRGKIAISLEPGGQVECSLGIMKSPEELNDLYAQFRADIDPILAKHSIRLINYGYTPVSSARDIRIIPKHRYAAMNEFFGRLSGYGWNMMRGSASTQVSFDFSSEADAINKMRLAVAVGPILGYFFRNTPFFEGKLNELPLLRQHMWESIGTGRTGINTGLYDEDYSFERAAIDALATPLMAADTTHTPDAQRQGVWTASFENAADVYPDRELNEYEINHIISTHFTDVRLKNFIEMRHWDSLPIDRARLLTDIVVNLFTNPDELSRLTNELSGIRALDVQETKVQIQSRGAQALPYGKSLEFWREFLHADYTGEDIPGDSENSSIFQD